MAAGRIVRYPRSWTSVLSMGQEQWASRRPNSRGEATVTPTRCRQKQVSLTSRAWRRL